MKRFLIGISLIPILMLAACSSLTGGTPSSLPDVSSFQFLHRNLTGLIRAGYDDEKLALTHQQAQKIIGLVQKWQTSHFGLNKAEAKAVYDSVLAVYTPEQKAWQPRQGRTGGNGNGQAGAAPPPRGAGNGPIGDGPPAGRPAKDGPRGGHGPMLTADYQKLFDELIDQLGMI